MAQALTDHLVIAMMIILVIGCMTVLEVAAPRGSYPLRARVPGLGFNIVTALGGGLMVTALKSLWGTLGIAPVVIVPVRGLVGDVLSVAAALLLFDFIAYWNHRFQHRFLWRVHALHHCQTELHAANDYAHFTEQGFRYLLFILPLSLIDFDFAATPVLVALLRSSLEFYIHSPTKLHFGRLSTLLVDNRSHRIHHSLDERHFDKNFGILFSFWDRLFGTAYEPGNEWPETGVAGLRPPQSLTEYLIYPLNSVSSAPAG